MRHNCNNCKYTKLLPALEVRSTHLFCVTHVETVHNSWGCELHEDQTLDDVEGRYDLLYQSGHLKKYYPANDNGRIKLLTGSVDPLPKIDFNEK